MNKITVILGSPEGKKEVLDLGSFCVCSDKTKKRLDKLWEELKEMSGTPESMEFKTPEEEKETYIINSGDKYMKITGSLKEVELKCNELHINNNLNSTPTCVIPFKKIYEVETKLKETRF